MMNISARSHRFLISALLGLSFIFLMLGNGLINLTHPDEVFYVQTAQEMIDHKDWSTPYIFGHPQFEKPIFFYWLLAVGIKLFGSVPFVARFWPSLFGMLGVIVIYWLSWMMFSSKRLSFLAGLITCTSFIYLGMSRAVLTDIVFTFWIIAALACFYWAYIARQDRRQREAGIILFFVCCAMGVLTKGLLGLCFPLTIAHLYLRYKKELTFFNGRAGLIGLLVFAGLAFPWHLEMYRLYGQPFIDEYWYNVHIRRLFEAEHRRLDTWHFYPSVMFGGMMPWTFFLFPALFLAGKKILGKEKGPQSPMVFLLIWVLVIFVVQQLAKSKLASYILPIYPALAIVTAYYFDQAAALSSGQSFRPGFKAGGYGLVVLLTVAIGVLIFSPGQLAEIVRDPSVIYLFAFLLFFCIAGLVISLEKRRFAGVIAATVNVVVSILIVFAVSHRAIEPWAACKAITDVLKQIDSSDSVVITSKMYARAVHFYTDRKVAVIESQGKGFFSKHPIPVLDEPENIREFLRRQPVTYGILRKGTFEIVDDIVSKHRSFRVTVVSKVADKYLVKIEYFSGL